ncbi:MAG: succinate dehydrogenase, cytochrome b556 subunit [Caulobacterales bacterium]|nr:succinate dehydrogenase, cytochrome b556 subunit [Caulobacterales bacterium]MCA0372042.1 succinate dehydrogenase, cytochrome b556 subunit [Pseudomonadota bacterium]
MAVNSKAGGKARPLSPHLQIWRWHVTMATSILHRATGVANSVALLLLIAWICSLADGEESYASFQSLVGSPFGKLVLFGVLISVSYHLWNGVRHLFFNLGIGLSKDVASKTGWGVIIIGALGGVLLFVLGLMAAGR